MFAQETKTVKLYSFDSHGIYCGTFDYKWEVGTGIAASSALEKPLKEKDGFVSVWNGSKWEYKENHLGKTIYSTVTKESKTVDYLGEIQQGWTFLEPIELGVWNGSAWVDNRTPDQIAKYTRAIMTQLTPIEFDIKLVDAGLYDQVQELIASDIKLKISYNRATFFSRTDPFVDQARIALNLTDEQVDTIWESSFV